jgi:hypothetical protein
MTIIDARSWWEKKLRDRRRSEMSYREAKELQFDVQVAVDEMVRALERLRQCGVSSDYMEDTLKGLADEISNLEAAILHQLDGNDPNWEGLDLVDFHSLLKKVTT